MRNQSESLGFHWTALWRGGGFPVSWWKSRKSNSRSEMLSSAVVDSEVPGKEKLLLRGKTKAAVEMRMRMGNPADTTDLLIERLSTE